MTKSLAVWWDQDIVGTLKLNRTGRLSFGYSPEWLMNPGQPAVSLSLPKREQRFSERECRPFFAGLLPEDEQLDIVAAALGLSKQNNFALLTALGGDVAGALTLWPGDQRPPAIQIHNGPKALDERELAKLLETLPKSPLLVGQKDLRLSLAGAQPKLPVVVVNQAVALPERGQPTTHILKPPIARFDATTENEALVMRLAARIGLDVAQVETRTAAGRSYLLVTRYDRRTTGTGSVQRLHQEDFCQALGIAPEYKYEAEGGPTFADSFSLLRRASSRPAVDILKLLDAAIFNLVVGNSDAHGKNFSLLYVDGEIRLAPLYDLLSTMAYPELSPRLAMRIGKRAELHEMGIKTWPQFAESTGLSTPFVVRRVRAISQAVGDTVIAVVGEFAPPLNIAALNRYAALIQTRAARALSTAA